MWKMFIKEVWMLNFYLNSYFKVLKGNFMLVLIAFVLLAVTFFIWAGVPFFIVPSLLSKFTTNFVIVFISISISGGFLFSLYFAPFNLKVAKNIGNIKGNHTLKSFIYLQTIFIFVSSLVFAIVLCLINVLLS